MNIIHFGLLRKMHWRLMLMVFLLTSIGVLIMISAAGGAMEPWANAQMIRALLGVFLMLAIAVIPTEWLMRYAYIAYGACLLMLIAVELAGFIGMGAQRWVSLGAFNLQPSELMKLALILALARYFHGSSVTLISQPLTLVPPLLMTLVPAMLILHQPNLGTATTLSFIAAVMFLAAGVKLRYFLYVLLPAIACAPIGWHFLHDYQKRRILTFLNPENDPLGAGYNIIQSKIAIGSGGFLGKGFLQGSQGQLSFLPEKQTDFVFTLLTEEFGFAGGMVVISLYAMLIFYAYHIALSARHMFGALIATGVASLIFIHVFINIAMVMGMLPVVGLPLPLLSYGGSMMIAVFLGFGLLQHTYLHPSITPKS